MIRRIILHNYMSHVDTVIEPAPGLTVLVGPNNCGKSAVVSALQTLCNNASGDYMVRHEEREARVTVETDDGHKFVWKRRGNTVSYIINERDIHRLKGSVPDDLHRLLRLPKVDAGERADPFDIHFGAQKSPIFLLNESESRAALFFASSSDAAILLEMQHRHRNKVLQAKTDEKRVKGEVEKLDSELAALMPLDSLAQSVLQAEGQFNDLQDRKKQIRLIGEKMERLHAQVVKHERLAREHQCLAPLQSPPQLKDARALELLLSELASATGEIQHETARRGALQQLLSPPRLEDDRCLANSLQSLSQTEQIFSRGSGRVSVLKGLRAPPVLEPVEKLVSLYSALDREERKHRLRRERLICLGRLTSPPKFEELGPLADLITRLKRTNDDYEVSRGDLNALLADLDNLKANFGDGAAPGPAVFLPSPHEKSPLRHMPVAVAALAVMAVVVLLFMFVPAWVGRTARESSRPARKPLDPTAGVVAQTGEGRNTRKLSATRETTGKELPRVKKEPLKKQGPKEEPPKKEQPGKIEKAKQDRLKQVRQLLKDADMASRNGKHLDALLGFGQAAVLYPQELAEVENTEKVKLKFTRALKRYQAQVESALQKAAEEKPRDK